MGEGIPLPRWGAFLDFGVLKPGFVCIIKLKLTSILAPNILRACMQKLLNPLFIILHVFIDFNRSLPCASKSPISTSKMFLEI